MYLAFLVCTTLSPLIAQSNDALLGSESFSSSGPLLDQSSGGFGWSTPWVVQNNVTAVPGYNLVSATPLRSASLTSSDGYVTGGVNYQTAGRVLDTSATGPFAQYVNNGLIGQAGQTLFFGLLMRKEANNDDDMSVSLHSTTPAWWVNGPSLSVGHFGGASNSGGIRYWSLKLSGTVYRTGIPVVLGETAFLVVRITFATTNQVALFVNPPASGLPSAADLQASTTDALAFRSVAYYAGSGPGQSSIDELRFAGAYNVLLAGSVPPPQAPTGISATPGNTQVTLTWTPVSGVTGYSIYRVVNGVGQLQTTVTSSTATVAGLTNGTSYSFYATAYNSAGTSQPSSQVTTVPHGPAPPPHPSLGTNLSAVTDYGREWPFVDAFKSARQWIPQMQGRSWGQGPALALDANGWITSLQPGQYAETIMLDNAGDDQPNYPSGQYVLLYDGSGTLSFDLQSATIVSQTPGRIVVNVSPGQNGIFLIESATDPANPVRNIRFIMPGFESTYQTQPFHPLFLQRLQNYQVLRFMEWALTNGSSLQNWADRPVPGDYTYCRRGVPLEVMIQLANTLNVKPWFNIPAPATDDYIRQFASTVRQQLSASLSFYLEYSNETWNPAFPQSAYVQAQGQLLNLSNNPVQNGAYYTSLRSVQMFNIFLSVFGSTSRYTRVIASQSANSWLSDQMLGFQNAYGSTDALAIAPYFNCSDVATGGFGMLGDPSTAAQVAAMSVDQVNNIQFAHINNCTMQQMQSNSSVANRYGLKLVAYEGGESLVGYGGAENNTALTSLFGTASRSSQMTSLYGQYFQNWVNAGGDLFVHYTDVASFSKWGNFGTLEYQDQDLNTAPKYQALKTFALQHP